MLKKISLAIVIGFALLFVYAATLPSDYFIFREITINAKAETIYPFVNSSKKANQWMPWIDMDPSIKMNYSGPEEGMGSSSNWSSDGKMGVGSATIIESIPNKMVKTKLEYKKPFEGVQEAEFLITESNNQSVVKWSVRGKNNVIGRFFCIFMNMDKMVGGNFEQGLLKLKTLVESK